MIFTKLSIRNFLGVSSVDVDLDNKGLVLIQGVNSTAGAFDSNGAGKSTIFADSICWALFGETIRGIKGDSVVRKQSKNNCSVTLTIVDGENEYTVTRHRKHSKHKNAVHLFKNGENITSKSDTDTTNSIKDLLDLDYISFTNSIVFGDGISKKFASATDSEKKEILEKILQIDIFKKCSELARKKLSNITSDIDMTNLKMQGCIKSISDKERYLEELHEKEEYARQKAEDNKKLYEGHIQTALAEIKTLEEEILACIELLNSSDKDRDEVSKMTDTLKQLNSKYMESNYIFITLNKELNDLYSEMDSKNKQLTDLIAGVNVPKFCKACGQSLPVKDTSHLQEHLKNDLKELLGELPELKGKVENQKEDYLKLKELHDRYNEEVQAKSLALNSRLNTLQSTIALKKSKIEQNNRDISMYTKNIETAIKESQETYSSIIDSVVHDIEDTKEQQEVYNDMLKDLNITKTNLEFWVNAYGNKGIKNMLLNDVTPFLNTKTNYYLSQLSDSTMEVEFDTESQLKSGKTTDKFSLAMTNKAGDDSYGGSSGGEKKRVDVAINMALQDLVQSRSSKKIDFIIYDEVFDALDETGCENVIKLLNEKASAYGSVFVITHNEHLQQLFPTTVTVEKTEEGTVLHS